MNIGYARVSTDKQNHDLQIDSLKQAGCEKIYCDTYTGKTKDRPELQTMLDTLRTGDTVIIWRLDRLGRSIKDLIHLMECIEEKGAQIKSLNDPIDTTTPSGKLIFHVFSAIAEFERNLLSERTKAGLEAARKRGRVGGRPKGLSAAAKVKAAAAETLYKEQELSSKEIAEQLNISTATLYRYLRYRGCIE